MGSDVKAQRDGNGGVKDEINITWLGIQNFGRVHREIRIIDKSLGNCRDDDKETR